MYMYICVLYPATGFYMYSVHVCTSMLWQNSMVRYILHLPLNGSIFRSAVHLLLYIYVYVNTVYMLQIVYVYIHVCMHNTHLEMMPLVPPSFALILRQTFVKVGGLVFFRVLATTHCVRTPIRLSPARFTSAGGLKEGYG